MPKKEMYIYSVAYNIICQNYFIVAKTTILIVLHTTYWSSPTVKLDDAIEKIGDEQMEWFEQQLKDADKDEKAVIIAGHIPPGYFISLSNNLQ